MKISKTSSVKFRVDEFFILILGRPGVGVDLIENSNFIFSAATALVVIVSLVGIFNERTERRLVCPLFYRF
jgi:hypothetical protein